MNLLEKENKIINNIKSLAQELGKTPTRREYFKKFGNPQFENVGGFSLMLEKAGFVRNKYNNLSNEDIKNLFRNYIKKNGIPISYKFPKTLPSYDLVCSRFGSYKKFLNLIGYDTLSYTKDDIIKLLQKGIDSGEIKSIIDLSKKGYPVPATIYKILGTKGWKDTLKLINRELKSNQNSHFKYNYTQEELKEMYFQLSSSLKKDEYGASKGDIKIYLNITSSVYERVFKKTLVELKEEWGFTTKKTHCKYTKDKILLLLQRKIEKKGNYLTIREIINDKELPAITTIYRIFKTKSLKKIYSLIEK